LSDVIPFEFHLKKRKAARQATFDLKQLTVERILEQLQKRKAQDTNWTQAEVARQAGISPGYLSQILNGQRPLSDKHKQRLYTVLFDDRHGDVSAIKH
jgi:AraC-like DNA-binding protein